MKNLTVTEALRKSIKKVTGNKFKGCVYSDTRFPEGKKSGVRAVGVKFVGLYLTDKEKAKVAKKLVKKGFKFHYININVGGNSGYILSTSSSSGTRFCFSKIK
jgi:hypothetical protein